MIDNLFRLTNTEIYAFDKIVLFIYALSYRNKRASKDVSPFSHFLYELRTRRDIRQAELAELLGYEQSYISALEVGLKGPPTDEFVERLIQALAIPQVEQNQLRAAAQASQRKLVIDSDAPPDIYWLLNDLRGEVKCLKPGQVRMIREILGLRETLSEERLEPLRRLKRRGRKEEATM